MNRNFKCHILKGKSTFIPGLFHPGEDLLADGS